MTFTPKILTSDNPASVKRVLEDTAWGYSEFLNFKFITCPWCQSIIPGHFTNAHELPSDITPKAMHILYHMEIAQALRDLKVAKP